ncbi:right-handed parallel beta-helix repeat-containing protein [Dyadobacter subterraneus]|uniref:Right-handed parallel beta-helix repeat-containing protein n=1 Tax=Dyadobacter subterraneus TaxID=2773304 RepID=A0ABR9WBG5_9BACT|nr:right-handed parallel beta-helix repeat-containing protein [Dyadobacter subterraneus]MBE9462824.1 right-handed parallel beta-helix repeat-containing protein [Dyadobacter subterraneus]
MKDGYRRLLTLQPEINTVSVVDRNTLVINNALKIAPKVVITYSGKYWCRGNRGGEGGSYYRYDRDPAGITWWQAGDGNGSPGGINIPSNRTFEMRDNVTLKMRGTFMHAYNFITIWNKENVTIRGGNIIGDFDLDPALNEHKRADGTFDEGQWGYGISLQGSKNVLIENVDISKMWADGINLSPDYLHNYIVNSNITIRNTKSHHNRRQGMSIDGGSKLTFYGCEFSNIKGQDPQSGVDLERDTNNSLVQLKDVLFIGCKFLNNMIGARTAYSPKDEISVKFDHCLFDGNVSWDYDSYTASGIVFTNCKFAYQQSRFFSIELVGTKNHKFENCEFNNAIRTRPRDVGTVTYRCKNLYFENSKCLNVRYNSSNLYKFFDLSNSINAKIKHCKFESTSLQDDRILISADGAENIEVINNTMRELGEIFVIKNVNGFKFNNNTEINTLRVTGIFKGNVKHFEMCRNQFSGNSYFSKNALAPVLYLDGTGTAFGKITDNVVYKDAIFTPISKPNSNGTGLYREYSSTSDNIVIANNKTFGFTNENAFQFNVASTNLSVSYFK